MLHRGVDSERVRRLRTGFHGDRGIAPQGVFGAEGEQMQVTAIWWGVSEGRRVSAST